MQEKQQKSSSIAGKSAEESGEGARLSKVLTAAAHSDFDYPYLVKPTVEVSHLAHEHYGVTRWL